jgi:hypothetical protein
MNAKMNNLIKITSILILLSCLATPFLTVASGTLSPEYGMTGKNNVVGVFGDQSDSAIEIGMKTYLNSISRAYVELSIDQIQDFSGQIVIFAHGEETGIRLSSDLELSWETFSQYLSKSKAERIILASCYGEKINDYNYNGPTLFSWNDKMDAVLTGYIAALYTNLEDGTDIGFTIDALFARARNLIEEKVEPLYLASSGGSSGGNVGDANSESGYKAAYKRESGKSGRISYRILWLNFDHDTGKNVLTAIDVVGILSGLLALLPGPVGKIIAVVLNVLIKINKNYCNLSSYNRKRHDYKVGIKVYYGNKHCCFVYHRGNDGFRESGILHKFHNLGSGDNLYWKLGRVQSYWKPFSI